MKKVQSAYKAEKSTRCTLPEADKGSRLTAKDAGRIIKARGEEAKG